MLKIIKYHRIEMKVTYHFPEKYKDAVTENFVFLLDGKTFPQDAVDWVNEYFISEWKNYKNLPDVIVGYEILKVEEHTSLHPVTE